MRASASEPEMEKLAVWEVIMSNFFVFLKSLTALVTPGLVAKPPPVRFVTLIDLSGASV